MADDKTGGTVKVVLPPAETFEQAAVLVRQLQEGVAITNDRAATALGIFLLAADFATDYALHMRRQMLNNGVATTDAVVIREP